MPTTCAVVGCHNRQSKHSLISFYRFPKNKDRRRQWVAFVSRKNVDGTPWKPGSGDRVCSEHFVTGKKSDVFNTPNYVPSIQANNPETIKESNAAMVRFQRVSHRSKLQEERRKQLERDTLALREATEQRELMLRRCQYAFNNDHTYATQQSKTVITDLSSVQCQGSSILLETLFVQPGEITMMSTEVQSEKEHAEEDNSNTSIPAEIGKTAI